MLILIVPFLTALGEVGIDRAAEIPELIVVRLAGVLLEGSWGLLTRYRTYNS